VHKICPRFAYNLLQLITNEQPDIDNIIIAYVYGNRANSKMLPPLLGIYCLLWIWVIVNKKKGRSSFAYVWNKNLSP